MPPNELHVIGIDPGKVTGWSRFTVPRENFFPEEYQGGPDQRDPVLEWEYGEISGRESDQVWELCRLVRTVQGLAYKVGPAVVVEGFDFGNPNRDPEVYSPVRLAAMLTFCAERTALLDSARVSIMPRTLPKEAYTDERLKALGYYVKGPDHMRDSVRIALTALKRARTGNRRYEIRTQLWGNGGALAAGFRCSLCGRLGTHDRGCEAKGCPFAIGAPHGA
ncbi:MAG TPA: hypothetical protein VH164_14595, partial [Ktedonobacteraceae bacterium]|nr:hypothetical protein [Ktedonobacteraceae bacterium]